MWDGELAEFYCPVCGVHIITPTGVSKDFCNHVKFLYVPESGEFENIDQEFKALLTEEMYETESDIVGALMEKVKSNSAVAFNLTTCGVGCGPTSFTVSVGIDFNPNK